MRRRPRQAPLSQDRLAGFRFPPEVIVAACTGTCATACHAGVAESCDGAEGVDKCLEAKHAVLGLGKLK